MVTSRVRWWEKRLGKTAWIEGIAPSMGAEDFSYYLRKVPGASCAWAR